MAIVKKGQKCPKGQKLVIKKLKSGRTMRYCKSKKRRR